MPISTFPSPNKDKKFFFPNTFGIPDAEYFAIIRSITPNITTTSIDYSILTNDNIIIATTLGITLSLPTAVGKPGKIYSIDNNSVGDIFVTGIEGELIQGLSTQIIPTQSTIDFYSDNVGWRAI